jgi:hypothetical protein
MNNFKYTIDFKDNKFFAYHDYNPLCLYGLAGVLLSPLLCKKNHQRYQFFS